MIRWCSYCQAFLGESAPFDSAAITHGICDKCDAREERGEDVHEDTEAVRVLMQRVFERARDADDSGCEELIAEARATSLDTRSLLVGLLQPALYQAGLDWQANRMTIAGERRFTAWCQRVFDMLPAPARPAADLDVVLFSAPGNRHTLGPRFAARILAELGLAVEAVVPSVPFEEMVTLASQLRPRFIAFSCALPEAVTRANDVAIRMRERLEPELTCRYVLGGFAFRLGNATPALGQGVEVVLDADALALVAQR